MSKSKKLLTEPKEYDTRVVFDDKHLGAAWVQRFRKSEWMDVKFFWSDKDAENWLKGGVPSYRFKS